MATGAVQFALGGASYDTPIGLVDGGSWGEDTQAAVEESIGGIGEIVAGPALPTASLSYRPVSTDSLLLSIIRASYPAGIPAYIPLHVGDGERGIKSLYWLCNTAELACEAEGSLTVDMELLLMGKPTFTSGGGDHSGVAVTTLRWYRGSVKVGTSNMEARAARFKVDNGLIAGYTLDAGTSASLRYPDSYDIGAEKPDITCEYYAYPSHDLSGDEITTADIVMICNTVSDGFTVTVTATGAKVIDWSTGPVLSDGRLLYSVNYRMDWNSGAFTIAAA